MPTPNTKSSIPYFLRKLPIKLLIASALFIIAVILFGYIVHEAVYKQGFGFDNRVIELLAPYSREPIIGVMKFFTFFGSGAFLIPAYVIVVLLCLWKRRKVLAVHVAIIAVTSTVLSQAAKRFFKRQRPGTPVLDLETTFSFPSGHSFSSLVFFSVVIYLISKLDISVGWKWAGGILLFTVIVMIGLSRLILKMHYPTDVIAGFCLGFIWVALSFYILSRVQAKSTNSDPGHVAGKVF